MGGESTRAEVSQTALAPHEPVRVVAPARATPSQVRARTEVGLATGHACELVHSDSQAKYAHVIAGLADIAYSRRGNGPGKYVWDHAGAILLGMTLLMNGVAIYVRYRFRKRIHW